MILKKSVAQEPIIDDRCVGCFGVYVEGVCCVCVHIDIMVLWKKIIFHSSYSVSLQYKCK